MWPIIWIVFMLGLVIATGVMAMREKSARAKVAKQMQPQPLDDGMEALEDMAAEPPAEDGFGEADGFAELDENAFK